MLVDLRLAIMPAYYSHDRGRSGDRAPFSILRQEPRVSSEAVRDAQGHRVLVSSPSVIAVADVEDGDDHDDFLRVKIHVHGEGFLVDPDSDFVYGYLARQHVAFVCESGAMYLPLSRTDWWSRTKSWTILARDCDVQCRHSTKPIDPDSIGETEESVKSLVGSHGYTYIAMYIGRPFSAERRVTACRVHHITLCYAAFMFDEERDRLQQHLRDICERWFRLKPVLRPRRLIALRKARLRSPDSDWIPPLPLTLANCSEEELTNWHSQNRLETSPHDRSEPTLADFLGWRERDLQRLQTAFDRVPDLMPRDQPGRPEELTLSMPLAGLGQSLELHDLLWYLQDCILHWSDCYFQERNSAGILRPKPPFTTGKAALHVSPQSYWQRRWGPGSPG